MSTEQAPVAPQIRCPDRPMMPEPGEPSRPHVVAQVGRGCEVWRPAPFICLGVRDETTDEEGAGGSGQHNYPPPSRQKSASNSLDSPLPVECLSKEEESLSR